MNVSKCWIKAVTVAGLMMASHVFALGQIPSPPEVAVKSYILIDSDSDEVLASNNPDMTIHPASLTKMMTSYLAEMELSQGNIHRDDLVTISKKAWSIGGSTMFIEVGEKVKVDELLKGIIIVSGNDASIAISEHVAGSEDAFAQLMNSTAKNLGMSNTHFQNASGWPADNHYSTARDLAVLSKRIVHDYPEDYGLYAEKYYQYGVDKETGEPLRRQANRNRLLWSNPSVDGLKTGHIEETGYHLAVTSKKDGRRLIAILLGASTDKQRAEEAQKLLTYGFRFFENVDIKPGGVALETVDVWKGAEDSLAVGIAENLVVTVPRGTGKDIQATLTVNPDLQAPIVKGQEVGSLVVSVEDTIIKKVPLIAQQSIEQGGFLKRIWDSILLFVQSLFK